MAINNKIDFNHPLGSDFECTDDLVKNFRVATGTRNLINALYRILITPPGGLFYDPEYGVGIFQFVNSAGINLSYINSLIKAQMLRDERVDNAEVKSTLTDGRLYVTIDIVASNNTSFQFVVAASQLNTQLISFS